MNFNLSFPRASAQHTASGVIKTTEDDFYVEELMNPELSGEGEHVWIWLEKTGQNTEYVASQIAIFANVKKMDIGFSGQKDRWARTRQWFSVYLGPKPEPDWQQFDVENIKLLKIKRHSKKLRRGEHQANQFRIVVRELRNIEHLESGLALIEREGFPNYFGPQRFGRKGANLERGSLFFEGEIKASRSQRSFYISAARSFLFNLNLAKAIEGGAWLTDSKGGPLYGDPQEGVAALSENEQSILDAHPSLAKGIHQNRLKLERRSFCMKPQQMSWHIEEGCLSVSFSLPTGIFATSLLAEVIDVSTVLGEA